jgi:TolB protein
MNADGSSPKKITDGTAQSPHLNPAWSPDGKEIAFTSLADGIDVVDPSGKHLRTVAAGGEFAAWSPDGKWIVFDRARGQTNPYKTDLYIMRADGSRQRLIDHPDGYDVMANWSPDGRHIAYVRGADYWTGQVLFVMTPTGNGYDVIGAGPGPSQIWQLTLNGEKKVVAREQLSQGPDDFFPHYSPVHNPF